MKQKLILTFILSVLLFIPLLTISIQAENQRFLYIGANHDFGITKAYEENASIITTKFTPILTATWTTPIYVRRLNDDYILWDTPSPLITDNDLNEIIRYTDTTAVSRYGMLEPNTQDDTALSVVFGGIRLLNLTSMTEINTRSINDYQYTAFTIYDEEENNYIIGSSGLNKIYKIDPISLNTILTSDDDYAFSEADIYSVNRAPYGQKYLDNLIIIDTTGLFLVNKTTLNKISFKNIDTSFQSLRVKDEKIYITYLNRVEIYSSFEDENPTILNFNQVGTLIYDTYIENEFIYLAVRGDGSRCEFTTCGEVHRLNINTGIIEQDYYSRGNLVYSIYVDEYISTFNEPVIETIGINNLTHNSVELIGNLTSMGTPESVNVFFQYKKQSESEFTNTPTQLLNNESLFSFEITGLEQNTQYEFKAVVQYEDPEIVGALIKNGSTLNFTTEELIIVFGDDFLIGHRTFGTNNNIFKFDLINLQYIEFEPLSLVNPLTRWDSNEDVIILIDRDTTTSPITYTLKILNKANLKLIEEVLVPTTSNVNPSGIKVENNKVFVGVENRIFILDLDTYTGSYSIPYSSFSNDIRLIETDETHIYFSRLNTGGVWKFEKDNINMSFTPENSFSTTTPKEILITDNYLIVVGVDEVRIFNKFTTDLLHTINRPNAPYVQGSLKYDENRNRIYYSIQTTLGVCGAYNLYSINPLTGIEENILTLDNENGVCANPDIRGFDKSNDVFYLTGSYQGINRVILYTIDEVERIEILESPNLLRKIQLSGELEVIFTEPLLLGMPPTKQLNQNELYTLNLFDYFRFAETINLSIYSQNPNNIFDENLYFNGVYNNDYAQFSYDPLTGEFNYLSKILDYEVTFKATACNEFGCVEDLFRIETNIIPLGLKKSFPNIIIKPDSFRYSFIDEYINEEEQNITNIKLYDEFLNLTIIDYEYISSDTFLNQYYSITLSEDVNGRTFIYYETYNEEYETNITITLTDIDGLKINDTYKFIITDAIPTQVKSIKNPVMKYNDEYVLKLQEHFNDFTAVFFGFYETDALEYKIIVPNEVFQTSYAEFSYINNTIKIISFEEEYKDLGIPATIQACNTNGCSQAQELIFSISEKTFFENNFGWIFPPAEELTSGQRNLRVLITIGFLLLMVVVLGVQSPEAKPYLVPIGSILVLLAIITFTLMSYLSLVLLITLIFTGVLLGVGLIRRILIGSNGD